MTIFQHLCNAKLKNNQLYHFANIRTFSQKIYVFFKKQLNFLIIIVRKVVLSRGDKCPSYPTVTVMRSVRWVWVRDWSWAGVVWVMASRRLEARGSVPVLGSTTWVDAIWR